VTEGGSLLLRLIGAQIRAQMQYKVSFLTDFLATFLGMLLEFASVAVLFLHIPTLGGWTLPQVAFLYGTAEVSLATARLFTNGFDAFPETIRLGSFDRVLIRPRSTFFQLLAADFSLRQAGRVLQGVWVLGFALWWLGEPWGVERWLFLGWTLLGGTAFFSGLLVIGGTLAFWTVESLEAINILTYGGATMASYPMNIYATWMRNFFLFVVPLAFVNFYPALVLLGKSDPFALPPFVPYLAFPACLLVFLASVLFWRFGVKHYQSTGH